jgi:hypothetical protein
MTIWDQEFQSVLPIWLLFSSYSVQVPLRHFLTLLSGPIYSHACFCSTPPIKSGAHREWFTSKDEKQTYVWRITISVHSLLFWRLFSYQSLPRLTLNFFYFYLYVWTEHFVVPFVKRPTNALGSSGLFINTFQIFLPWHAVRSSPHTPITQNTVWVAYQALTTSWGWQPHAETCRGRNFERINKKSTISLSICWPFYKRYFYFCT